MFKELKQDFALSSMVAGIIAVVVSYGGPAAIIFQAASVAGLDKGQLTSWVWAVSIGSGLTGLYLSYRLKTPVITAWSTPGAALLVTGWSSYSYPEAIGCPRVHPPPRFTWRAIIGLGIPLCLVTLAGQNATGLGVIRAAGYTTPANPLITTTGLVSVLLAPFGAHGVNLAAITAAICTGPAAHPDPQKRYPAGMACGLCYRL
jgi:predicted benzoate:H+ symporter BenE